MAWCHQAANHHLSQCWPMSQCGIARQYGIARLQWVDITTFSSFLTHWGRVTHICVSWLDHHRFRSWLVAWTAPSHYPNQCWNIVNWTLRNKLQWIFNRNSNIFIQGNAFENGVCEMASILSWPQCVNTLMPEQNVGLFSVNIFRCIF